MTQQTPPGWYPDPSGSAGQRYWDGFQWIAAPPPPPKTTNTLLIVGIVSAIVFLGSLFLGVLGTMLNKKSTPLATPTVMPSFSVPSFSMPSLVPFPSAVPTSTAPVAIGQPATDGQTIFTVTSVERSKIAGDPTNTLMQVTAQGEFLNVRLTVRNDGTEPQSFAAFNQTLTIGDSTYEADSSAALWTKAMNVSINPGNTIEAVISFDVPAGTSADGTVQLHESLISPGVDVTLS